MKALITLIMTAALAFSATPNLWMNQADIDKLAADIKKYPEAKKDFEKLISKADSWLDGTHELLKGYPDLDWQKQPTYPPRPAKWGDKGTKAWWMTGFGVHDLGLAFSLTGKQEYKEKCLEILKGLASVYHHYPREMHGAKWDKSKVFIQRLDEAMWGIDLAFGYSCISHALKEADRKLIEEKLLLELVVNLYAEGGQGPNNYTCVMDECAAAIGFALADDKWIKASLDGYHQSCGYKFLVGKWIEDDGSTREGAMGYHLMGLRALVGIAEMFRVAGQDIYGYNDNRIKKAMDFTIGYVFPDNTSPATHDGGRTKIESTGGSIIYQNMYLRFKDPAFLPIMKKSPTKLHSAQGNPELSRYYEPVTVTDLPSRSSTVFSHIGMAVLRDGPADNRSFVLMDYGPFDFHGHLDKLNIITYFAGAEMALDPGTFRYSNKKHKTWSVVTGAHNTVVVDGKDQAREGGTLELFDTTDAACRVMRATANTVYEGVQQQRIIALTGDYMLDIFALESDREHTYDWLYHNPGAMEHRYKLLGADGTLGCDAGYRHIRLTGRGTMGKSITVSFTRKDAVVTLRTVPEQRTELITATGLHSSDDSSVPMIVLRRKTKNTVFAVVHDFRGKGEAASVRKIEVLESGRGCRAYRVTGKNFTDILAVAETGGKHTISSGKEQTGFNGKTYYKRNRN